MSHFAAASDYGNIAGITFVFVVVFLLAAGLVGSVWRRPWLERQALGLLVLMGGADLAFYLARWQEWSLAAFATLAVLVIIGLTASIRTLVFVPAKTPPVRSGDGLVWPLFLALAFLLLAVRLETPFPQSGYSIFQALYPGYIQHSLLAGFPPQAAQTPMGSGHFLTNHMNYPADTLGLALLAAWTAGGGERLIQPIYLASTIVPGVAVIGLMLHGLRRSRPALLTGVVLLLVFLRFDNPLRLLVLDNWIDNLLVFSAAVTLFYLMAGESRAVICRGAAIASAFMVFSRPYGAAFAALVMVAMFWTDMAARSGPPRPRRLIPWLGIGAMLTVFTARELFLALTSGIYHAQPAFAQQARLSLFDMAMGTLYDWRLLPDSSHLMLPVPAGIFIMAALLALGWRYRHALRRRPGRFLVYLSPFLLLLGPFLLELAIGYRRGFGNASKLYLGAAFLFPFYPALLMSRLGRSWSGILDHRDTRLPRLTWGGGVFVGMLLAAAVVGPWSVNVRSKADHVIRSYGRNNPDFLMGELVAKAPEPIRREVVDRKIVFLFHEPGFGLRYFIGGDVLSDHDFFGERIQGEIAAGRTLEQLLEGLGYPSIWISYPSWRALGAFAGATKGWERVADEISQLTKDSPVVQCFFQIPKAALIMTRPPSAAMSAKAETSKNCAD